MSFSDLNIAFGRINHENKLFKSMLFTEREAYLRTMTADAGDAARKPLVELQKP